MHRHVVHALLTLLDHGVAVDLPGQLGRIALDFLQRLIDRHGADRHGRIAQDPLAGFVDVLAGGQVHDGVGPQRVAHTILSTSSAIELVTAELPMLALTFTANALPMIIGSLSGWWWLAGITARPRATSSRTSSADMSSRAAMNAISAVISRRGPAAAGCPDREPLGPMRQPRGQVDHRVRVGVGPGGVVEVEVVSGGQVHPSKRDLESSSAAGSLDFTVGLGAARDGTRGHRRFNGDGHLQLPTPALPGQVRTVDGPEPSSQRTRRALPRGYPHASAARRRCARTARCRVRPLPSPRRVPRGPGCGGYLPRYVRWR